MHVEFLTMITDRLMGNLKASSAAANVQYNTNDHATYYFIWLSKTGILPSVSSEHDTVIQY